MVPSQLKPLRSRELIAGLALVSTLLVLPLLARGLERGRTPELVACLAAAGSLGIAALYVQSRRSDRVRDRYERSLFEARERAEAATDAKSDFLAVTCHEIRTPLGAVIGLSTLLSESEPDELDEKQRELASMIRTSSESLLELVNEILDFSKIEAGHLELRDSEFDLGEVIRTVGELSALRAEQSGLELVTQICPDVPTQVVGDGGRLKQVLLNLTTNAIKFTPEGEVFVRVSKLREDELGVLLRFEVRDTGVGISQAKVKRLFQSYSQVDTSTTRRRAGTGLGLMISKATAEAMGGEIGVETAKGRGSNFWFTARLGVVSPAGPRYEPSKELQCTRVLVADDNETTRRVLSEFLTWLGVRAVCAKSGESAVEELRAASAEGDPIGLLLLDHDLAVSGEPVLSLVRADPRLLSTRVVLTGPISLRHRMERGEDAPPFLAKPVKESALFTTLEASVARDVAGRGERKRAAPRRSFAGARVLLADDSRVNRTVYTRLLERLGVEVLSVETGEEALDALSRGNFDLILMDRQMPEMDGIEATEIIRMREQDEGLRRIPIIAFTAHAGEFREECLEAGMDDYLSKPLKAEALEATLEQWLVPPPLPRSGEPKEAGSERTHPPRGH